MKKRILIVVLTIWVSLLFNGCKKSDPSLPPNSTSVFSFSGILNGNPVNISVGNNNYYMFTSTSIDSNQVKECIGELKDHNCISNCSNALKIRFKGNTQHQSNLNSAIDSILQLGYYGFARPSKDSSQFEIRFETEYVGNLGIINYSWNFGDSTIILSSNFHEISHTYKHPGNYTITCSAHLENGNNLAYSARIQIGLGNPPSFTPQASNNGFAFHIENITPLLNKLHLGTCIVEWRDATGKLWTSYTDDVSINNNLFELTGVYPYMENTNGQSTRKIQGKMNGKLFNGANTIEIKNGVFTLAVAY